MGHATDDLMPTHPLNKDPNGRPSDEKEFGTRHPNRYEPRPRAFQGTVNASILNAVPQLSLPTNPTEGMLVYLLSAHNFQYWNGTAWIVV